LILDYDKNGNVVGMEILQASKRIEDPFACDYAVTAVKKDEMPRTQAHNI